MDSFAKSLLLVAFNLCIISNADKVWSKNVDEDCKCGITAEGSTRAHVILNGERIDSGSVFPWMVALQYQDKLHCAGSLITRSFVLTAGHCVHGLAVSVDQQCPEPQKKIHPNHCLNLNDMKMALQTRDGNLDEFQAIRDVVMHPNYKVIQNDGGNYAVHDIALIQLLEPLNCKEYQKPICLPLYSSFIEANRRVVIAGWGDRKTSAPTEGLFSGVLQIQSSEACIESFPAEGNDTTFCAKGLDAGACRGGSGAPLITDVNGRFCVVGVAAHLMSTKCRMENPQYFTPVRDNLNWILDIVLPHP